MAIVGDYRVRLVAFENLRSYLQANCGFHTELVSGQQPNWPIIEVSDPVNHRPDVKITIASRVSKRSISFLVTRGHAKSRFPIAHDGSYNQDAIVTKIKELIAFCSRALDSNEAHDKQRADHERKAAAETARFQSSISELGRSGVHVQLVRTHAVDPVSVYSVQLSIPRGDIPLEKLSEILSVFEKLAEVLKPNQVTAS